MSAQKLAFIFKNYCNRKYIEFYQILILWDKTQRQHLPGVKYILRNI